MCRAPNCTLTSEKPALVPDRDRSFTGQFLQTSQRTLAALAGGRVADTQSLPRFFLSQPSNMDRRQQHTVSTECDGRSRCNHLRAIQVTIDKFCIDLVSIEFRCIGMRVSEVRPAKITFEIAKKRGSNPPDLLRIRGSDIDGQLADKIELQRSIGSNLP